MLQTSGDGGSLFLDGYVSKGWLPGLKERHSWVITLARPGKRLTFPRGRERIYIIRFTKVNA